MYYYVPLRGGNRYKKMNKTLTTTLTRTMPMIMTITKGTNICWFYQQRHDEENNGENVRSVLKLGSFAEGDEH